MCDEDTEADAGVYLTSKLTRRKFNTLAAGMAIATMLPRAANALDVTDSDVSVTTPDGVADCYFVHPGTGEYPGVIMWPDIRGLRPAYRTMAKRLAESGYAVLCVNPYYRSAKSPVVNEGDDFQDPVVREKIMPYYQALSPATHNTDAITFSSWLDVQSQVDKKRKLGAMGYCMGGPMAMRTASAVPDRVGAVASFHGAGLVSEGEDSPHLTISSAKASYLVAIAENDDTRQPDAKDVLRRTFEQAGRQAEVEVYEGALHGWCALDSSVYNEIQAEHAWARMLVLFGLALA